MKKTFLALLILSIALPAIAAEVHLAWDAVTPQVDGYRLYARQGGEYDYSAPIWSGSETDAVVSVPDNLQSAFVVRAFVTGNIDNSLIESVDSNEVVFTPDAMRPPPANNLLLSVIENLARALIDLTEYLKANG